MAQAEPFVTATGSRAVKGTKGFTHSLTTTRPNVMRIRLSDNELKQLQLLTIANNTTAAALIRSLINAITSD